MLIYLDSQLLQYCADYEEVVFGDGHPSPGRPLHTGLREELGALRKIIQIAVDVEHRDFENRWDVAAPAHLIRELLSGAPTTDQHEVYALLQDSWSQVVLPQYGEPSEERVAVIERSLDELELKDRPDQRHLAEAIAIGASWFLTYDSDILEKTQGKMKEPRLVHGVMVARPSQFLLRVIVDPVLGVSIKG